MTVPGPSLPTYRQAHISASQTNRPVPFRPIRNKIARTNAVGPHVHKVVPADAHEHAFKLMDCAGGVQVGSICHIALEKVDKHFRTVEGGVGHCGALKGRTVENNNPVKLRLTKLVEDVAHAQDVAQRCVHAIERDQALNEKYVPRWTVVDACAGISCGGSMFAGGHMRTSRCGLLHKCRRPEQFENKMPPCKDTLSTRHESPSGAETHWDLGSHRATPAAPTAATVAQRWRQPMRSCQERLKETSRPAMQMQKEQD